MKDFKELLDVTVLGCDSCFTYVLKRTGNERYCSYEPSVFFLRMPNITVVRNMTPVPGDILLWDKQTTAFLSRHISKIATTLAIPTGLHFAVLESASTFSEVVNGSRVEDFQPYIQVHTLSDIFSIPMVVQIQ